MEEGDKDLKELYFLEAAYDALWDLPPKVRNEFGHTLWLVQQGGTPSNASPFEGSKANEIMKLTERLDRDTYRAVYAAKFEKAVYVLHVFKKKSMSGIRTPQKEVDTVQKRLQQAKAEYAALYGTEETK